MNNKLIVPVAIGVVSFIALVVSICAAFRILKAERTQRSIEE